MKRYIVAGLGSLTLFGGALAAAATLGVTGGAVQAGSDSSLTCETSNIQVDSWNVDYTDADSSHLGSVTSINVSHIDPACVGNRLFGRVEDSHGNTIGYTTNIDPSTGAAMTSPAPTTIAGTTAKLSLIDASGNNYGVDPANITRVVFWVEGANS